jgi:tRNA pseudouridine38-40 synthase
MRYRLIIEYEGTAYCGWQIQPNGRTVQAELESAIGRMLGESVRVSAAGRTDAGAHASGQVVSFALRRDVPTTVLLRGLNALTPPDIAVRSAEVVADDFDPRRAAVSRTYVYRIWNATWSSPFWRRYAWHISRPLDTEAMRAAACAFIGEHDFTSFRAAGCEARHPRRHVRRSEIASDGYLLLYSIEADGFLRSMVRNIVGTLVEVGSGARAAAEITKILAARQRNCAGPTAPAHGLCLTRVDYEEGSAADQKA